MSLLRIVAIGVLAISFGGCSGTDRATANQVPRVGSSSDTALVQAAVDKGGLVTFGPGNYLITETIVVRKSGTTIQGAGPSTVFTFRPHLPQVQCANDRAFTTPCEVIFTSRRQVLNPITIGDESFSTNADISDIHSGDWLIVDEDDDALGGVPIAVDWAQVASISGNTISVTTPFRTAFSNSRPFSDANRIGLGFYKLPQLVENVTFRDLAIYVPDSGEGAPGISVFAAKDTSITNVSVKNANGQAFYGYLSKGLVITNSTGDSGAILNEFGATVDLTLKNDTFSSDQSNALGLDLGCAFFDISDVSIAKSANVGAYMILGTHDGSFRDSNVAYVTSAGNAVGVLLRGTQRINVTGNTLIGGAGISIAISDGAQTQSVDIPIPSSGNILTPNAFGSHWTTDVDQ